MNKNPKSRPAIERLLDRTVIQPNGCWLVTRSLDRYGYPRIWADGKVVGGHRLSYEHFVGDIPSGHDIDHECHNSDEGCPGGVKCAHRACVNPDHLQPKVRRLNLLAGKTIAARHAKTTHCPKNHPYTGVNLRITKEGTRKCIKCDQERQYAAYWADPDKYRARKRKAYQNG